MQIVVTGRNVHLSPSLKDYAEKKLGTVKKYFDHIIEVDVTLSINEAKDPSRSKICEVTVWANGSILRAQKASEDLYASVDMAADKIDRQIKKFKEKLRDNPRRHNNRVDKMATHKVLSFGDAFIEKAADEALADRTPKIVRSGNFSMKPMFADEAAEQLEMLRQDFYVFSNADTNMVNVIYKRNDGNFGLIEPDY